MKVDPHYLQYSPISRSDIQTIYPWSHWLIDFIALWAPNRLTSSLTAQIKKLYGTTPVYFVSSGRVALATAIQMLSLPRGSEILLTAFNCPAVIDAILFAGMTPVFVDCNENGGIDLKSAARALNPKTKAIIATNVYGLVDSLDSLKNFSDKNHIFFVNDLAQSFNMPSQENTTHTYGDIAIYSFGTEKHLFSLGGGMILINNPQLQDVEKALPKAVLPRHEVINIFLSRCWYYAKFFIHKTIPPLVPFHTHKHADDIQKSETIVPRLMHPAQLSSLSEKLKSYGVYANKTLQNFYLLKNLLGGTYRLLYGSSQSLPLYATIYVDGRKRYELANYLNAHHIATVWNYLPLYYYDAYTKYKVESKKTTEILWKNVLSVPFRYPLKGHHIRKIAHILSNYS